MFLHSMSYQAKKKDWQTELITGGKSLPVQANIVKYDTISHTPARSRNYRRQNRGVALDRWENPNNGFGMIGVDPVPSTMYQQGLRLGLHQIDALYRKDWLAQRIIELLPDAAIQKGFVIESETDTDGAKAVTKLLKKWKTKTEVKHLAYQARQYGGAAKINSINDGLPTAFPVNWRMIKSVDQTKICGRFYCRPEIFYDDPNDLTTYKKPWIYQVFEITYGTFSSVYQVHEERLSWLDGSYLPDHLRITNWGAGDSVLERVEEALKAYGSSIQSLSATIQDFVTKVLRIENMDDLLEENEPELQYRVEMADARSSIHGTAVIGPQEDMKKISTPITGLPESIVILMDTVSAAANTPKSKLFGNLTGTLGSSSGRYDRSNWDNQTETFQNEQLTPVIEDDMRLACAIENVNFDDLELIWADVKEQGEKETAQTRKLNAEAEAIELKNEEFKKGNNGNTD